MFTLFESDSGYVIKKYKGKDSLVIVPDKINGKAVIAIDDMAFKGKNLEEIDIPGSITFIGERAFCECKKLKKVSLHQTVPQIRRFAFWGCESLADREGFVVVDGIVFDYFGQKREIIIPENVRIIDDGAFGRIKRSLESVVIPDSVELLRCNAFYGCKKLKSVSINPEKTRMEASSFDRCSSLIDKNGFIIFEKYLCSYRGENEERLTIPPLVNQIGVESLAYQRTIKSLEIPEGVERINMRAFFYSSSFETIHISKSVSFIAKDAFIGCKATIIAPVNSYAIEFAKENNIPYIVQDLHTVSE